MATELKNIKRKFETTEAGLTLLAKQWGYGEDTRRITVCEDDGSTKRYYWDSTRLADQTGTYGAEIIGIDGITGVTPAGGSSGSAGTVRAMIRGIGTQLNFGSLTTNILPRKNSSNTLVDSAISDNGTTISMTRPVSMSSTLDVTGVVKFGTGTPSLATKRVTIIGNSFDNTALQLENTDVDTVANGRAYNFGITDVSGTNGRLDLTQPGERTVLSVFSNGRVGIGSTTDGGEQFQVTGTARVTGAVALSSTLAVTGVSTLASDLVLSASAAVIRSDTSDGSDTKSVSICGGGAVTGGQGAFITLHGNEHATLAGTLRLSSGDGVGQVQLRTNGALRYHCETTGGHIFATAVSMSSTLNVTGVTTLSSALAATSISASGGIALGSGTDYLSLYSRGTTSVSWTTGYASPVAADVKWERIGDQVTLRFAQMTGTSNAATLSTSSGALPAGIRPSQIVECPIKIVNNGAHEIGTLVINTNGAMEVFRDGYASFTASGAKGIQGTDYIIAHYLA